MVLKERITKLLGAQDVFLPDVIPIKRIRSHEMLPNHLDNAGFTDATVVFYFQTLKSGGIAFPGKQMAFLPRVGRAIVFHSRTQNDTIDYSSVHHTMKYHAEEGAEYRLSFAISVKILGGLDNEWFSSPHAVTTKRPSGFCHGIAAYILNCNEGQSCTPNSCSIANQASPWEGCSSNSAYLGEYEADSGNESIAAFCTNSAGCSDCRQTQYTTNCEAINGSTPGTHVCRSGQCVTSASMCRRWGRTSEDVDTFSQRIVISID